MTNKTETTYIESADGIRWRLKLLNDGSVNLMAETPWLQKDIGWHVAAYVPGEGLLIIGGICADKETVLPRDGERIRVIIEEEA